MAEKRYRLSDRQKKALAQAVDTANTRREKAIEADKQLQAILELIYDAFGLPDDAKVGFDDTTGELVLHVAVELPQDS